MVYARPCPFLMPSLIICAAAAVQHYGPANTSVCILPPSHPRVPCRHVTIRNSSAFHHKKKKIIIMPLCMLWLWRVLFSSRVPLLLIYFYNKWTHLFFHCPSHFLASQKYRIRPHTHIKCDIYKYIKQSHTHSHFVIRKISAGNLYPGDFNSPPKVAMIPFLYVNRTFCSLCRCIGPYWMWHVNEFTKN